MRQIFYGFSQFANSGLDSEASMSTLVLLLAVLVQRVLGTFPPASNPPPIPVQTSRTLDIPQQQYYIQEDINQEPPRPNVMDGPFLTEKQEEQRWYIQESTSRETADNPSSIEEFDRFYTNGDPAVGPVATPLPDDAYVAQPSRISSINPGDLTNPGASDVWILTRGSDNQYVPSRWISVPTERVIEVVNQDLNPPVATDIVKSISAPVPEVSAKNQFEAAIAPGNQVRQVFIRAPNAINSQKVLSNPVPVVEEIAPVNQLVSIPQQSFKQIVQQQSVKDSFLIPAPPQADLPPVPAVSKKTFTVPPPPQPPLIKGEATKSMIVTPISGVTQESNVLVSDKSGLLQQMRHVWVPTSSRTGRFLSIPVTNVESGKSITNKGIQVDPSSITVSDTWVLKQDGPLPSFEKQNTLIPSPVVQDGKVLIPGSSFIQLNSPQMSQIVSKSAYTPNVAVAGKSVNVPLDGWPVRDFGNSKTGKSITVVSQDTPIPPSKSSPAIIGKSYPLPLSPVISPKSITSKSPPQLISSPVVVTNDKPCPLPLPPPPQKSLFPQRNPGLLTVPVANILPPKNKQPLTRILRVNRYPSGSYYLLNSRFRPNILTYPSPLIQQPKTGLVRLIQTKQGPVYAQTKQLFRPAVQTKAISIPVQTKVSPLPKRIVAYSLPTQQIISPAVTQKSSVQSFYPFVQAIRYAYPWNGYLKSSPVPGKQVLFPQLSSLKMSLRDKNSDSSSSESSSEESSEERKPRRKETGKPKNHKKEAKSKEEGSGESKEKEKETKAKSVELEKESEEIKAESASKESFEAAESHTAPRTRDNSETLQPYIDADKVYAADTDVGEIEVFTQLKESNTVASENETGNLLSKPAYDSDETKENKSLDVSS